MEEIKYIPYGTDQIDYDQFVKNASDEVQSYVNSQSWSSKRKQSFLNAYQDLMSRGITGASNNNGSWSVQHGGGDIDLESLSKKDREMYGEAAYFIRHQMEQAPTKSQREKEKQEALDKLPSYDNEHFVSEFNTSLSKNYYGGHEIDVQKDWNTLDKRDSKGLRGTENRAARLADALEKYSNELEEGKYNFKNSAFKDINDVKNKIAATVADLRDGNPDNDVDALNRIGLKYDNYFYNGADDAYTNGEYQGTYNDYYNNYLPKLEEQEAAQQQAQLKAEQEKKAQEAAALRAQQYKKVYFFGNNKFHGKSFQDLSKYSNPLAQLSSYSKLQNLNGEQISELLGAFKNAGKNGMLQNLSKEEQIKFSGFSDLNKAGRLKKIDGLQGFYWDSIGNRIVKPLDGDATASTASTTKGFNEAVKKSSIDSEQQKYLQQIEWTPDKTRELAGIAADVASIIDPEPLSAAGLSLTGTALRAYNRATDKDGFTWRDFLHTLGDAGLSIAGSVPIAGDTALTGRVLSRLQTAAGWLGLAFTLPDVPTAAKAAWDKVVNGKDLTLEEWRAIGNVVSGLIQGKRMFQNRSAADLVKNSGGGTKQQKVGEVEVKVNGNTEKVTISEDATKELKKAYKAAGSNKGKTTEALRGNQAVKDELKAMKDSKGNRKYTDEQISNIEATQAASGKAGRFFPGTNKTRGITTTTRTITTEGTPIPEHLRNDPRIKLAQRTYKYFGGSRGNSEGSWLKRTWKGIVDPYGAKASKTPPTTPPTTSTTKPNQIKGPVEGSSVEIPLMDGTNLKYEYKNGTLYKTTISTSGGANKTESFSSVTTPQEARKQIINEIEEKYKELRKSGINKKSDEYKAYAKGIKKAKLAGFLRSGGTLDTTIANFFKNNNL